MKTEDQRLTARGIQEGFVPKLESLRRDLEEQCKLVTYLLNKGYIPGHEEELSERATLASLRETVDIMREIEDQLT